MVDDQLIEWAGQSINACTRRLWRAPCRLVASCCDCLRVLCVVCHSASYSYIDTDPLQSKLWRWTEPANNNSAAAHTPLRTVGVHYVQKISIPK